MDDPAALRILVTGGSGQVGGELVKTLEPLGTVLAPSRYGFNLSDSISIRLYVEAAQPHWIINAGAYTAVDKAESEPDLAYAINAEAPRVIGEEARKLGAKVLHYSTDYVFSGKGTTPYVETDATGPLGVYGASKLAGEQALLASGAEAMIFRTSWVYGATGKNFLRTILKAAREREELRVVADQYGAPTWSRDLAKMAAHVVAHCERDGMAGNRGGPAGWGAGTGSEAGASDGDTDVGVSDCGGAAGELAAELREVDRDVWVADAGVARVAGAGDWRVGLRIPVSEAKPDRGASKAPDSEDK